MNNKIFYVSILVTGVMFVGVAVSSMAVETEIKNISTVSYPVAELGNCADKAACKIYCDKSEKIEACLSFAQKNNLMSSEEINTAKNFKKTGMIGPGGCKGKDECKTYCNGPDHMDECISFAEKNGLMSGKKLEGAKKVKGAISKGIKPPACGDKEACDVYCSSSEHVEECVKFGEAAGTINKDDAKKIRNNGGKKGTGGQGQGQGQGQNQKEQQGQGQGRGPKGQQGQGPKGQQGQGPKGQQGQGNGGGGMKGN